MSRPLQRVRTWSPATSERVLDLGEVRWVRVEGDVPKDLVLRTRELADELTVEPGHTIDTGSVGACALVAPATAAGDMRVWTGTTPVGESDTAPRGGAPRPWLEHVFELIRTIAPAASFTMAARTWIPYSTDAGQGLAHPFSRFLVVAEGNRSFTIDALDVFDGTNTVLIEQRIAIARPGGRFSTLFVLDFPYPRLELLATNTSANPLTLNLHLYGTR